MTVKSTLLLTALLSLPVGAQPAMGVLAGTLLGVDSLGAEFPLGARRVSFLGSDSLRTRTDPDGRFWLRVPVGERVLRVAAFRGGAVEVRANVAEGDTAHVTLRLPMRGFVYGREDPDRMRLWRSPQQMEQAARVLGWDREGASADRRELWISANYALFEPERFTRLVLENATVRGEVVEYWTLDPYNPWLDFRLRRLENADRCDTIAVAYESENRVALPEGDRYCASQTDRDCREPERNSLVVCRLRLEDEPDWAEVLADLERLDVWTLPDESALPPEPWITVDGWGLLVRAYRERNQRWYGYSNPFPAVTVQHSYAHRIAEALRAVGGVLAPIEGD